MSQPFFKCWAFPIHLPAKYLWVEQPNINPMGNIAEIASCLRMQMWSVFPQTSQSDFLLLKTRQLRLRNKPMSLFSFEAFSMHMLAKTCFFFFNSNLTFCMQSCCPVALLLKHTVFLLLRFDQATEKKEFKIQWYFAWHVFFSHSCESKLKCKAIHYKNLCLHVQTKYSVKDCHESKYVITNFM